MDNLLKNFEIEQIAQYVEQLLHERLANEADHDFIRQVAANIRARKESGKEKAPHMVLGYMPSYGYASANDMVAAIGDAIYGDRTVTLEYLNLDPERAVGHQMVPNINFNSLNRIISSFERK